MSRKKQVYEKITALYCRISLDDSQKSMGCSSMSIMWMTAIRAAISTVPRSSA